jgi:hypothetical protein
VRASERPGCNEFAPGGFGAIDLAIDGRRPLDERKHLNLHKLLRQVTCPLDVAGAARSAGDTDNGGPSRPQDPARREWRPTPFGLSAGGPAGGLARLTGGAPSHHLDAEIAPSSRCRRAHDQNARFALMWGWLPKWTLSGPALGA